MIKKLLPFLVFILLITIPSIVSAQPGDPGCSPDDPCPVDSGVILLIAAGVGIAAFKAFYAKRRMA